jgi:hypothetical protein
VLPENLFVGKGAVGSVVCIGEDLLGTGVGKVEGLLVLGPTDTVGDCQRGVDGVPGEIGVEAEKRALYDVSEDDGWKAKLDE